VEEVTHSQRMPHRISEWIPTMASSPRLANSRPIAIPGTWPWRSGGRSSGCSNLLAVMSGLDCRERVSIISKVALTAHHPAEQGRGLTACTCFHSTRV
jgi:hypothetical protein